MKPFITYTDVFVDITNTLGLRVAHSGICGTVRFPSCARHTISVVASPAFAPVATLQPVVNAFRMSVAIIDEIAGSFCSIFHFTCGTVPNISGSTLTPEAAGVVRVGDALSICVAIHLETRRGRSAFPSRTDEASIASADIHIMVTVDVAVRILSTVRTAFSPAFIAITPEARLTSADISLYGLFELAFGVG